MLEHLELLNTEGEGSMFAALLLAHASCLTASPRAPTPSPSPCKDFSVATSDGYALSVVESRSAEAQRSESAVLLLHGRTSVSYTHLTLPTKRIV